MKRVYFDHAAATPIDEQVLEVITGHLLHTFGNPSSIHREGVLADEALVRARDEIARNMGAHHDEIIFTASATESCNLAIEGAVRAWRAKHPDRVPHIIASAIEHDAVLSVFKVLEKENVITTLLPVDHRGMIDLTALSAALTMDTVLVSVGYANNEIGIVQPLEEIAKLIRKWKKEVRGVTRDVSPHEADQYPLFHTDACQAANYLTINVARLGVDMMTINAAKIYGPKGVALLFRRRAVSLFPLLHGGGHEFGLRSGTENVPYIAGFSRALSISLESCQAEVMRLKTLRDALRERLKTIPGLVLNSDAEHCLPNIVNFSLRGVSHEFLAIALDDRGFAVSTKSACNETDAEHSHVLSALCDAGHESERSGIRVSLGRENTLEDIDRFVDTLADIRENLIVTL